MFTAIERTTKMILTFPVGKRTPIDTAVFIDNLAQATTGRFQLTTDGFRPYLTTIPLILQGRVDWASLVKVYGNDPEDRGYSPGKSSIPWRRYTSAFRIKIVFAPRTSSGPIKRFACKFARSRD